MRWISQKDDKKLVRACAEGKPDAQRVIYERYADKMFAVCLRYARGYDDAQDMLQDGFIRVFNKIHLYEGKGSLEGWIRRVIVNVAIRACQKNSRMYVVGLDAASEEADTEIIEQAIDYQDLLKMVQSLPDGYRLVFNLYAIEGFSHKEIAEKLNITEGTSKSQLSRARKQLQKMVIEQFDYPEKKIMTES